MKLTIIAAAAVAMLTGGVAHSATYDLVADFDYTKPAGSTSGLFRYGYFDNAADTGFTAFTAFAACGSGSDFGCARLDGVDSLGATEHLAGTDTASGTSLFRAGYLNLHSGPSGQQSAVAFTATTAGSYSFDGRFQIHDTDHSGTATAAYNGTKSTAYLPLAALTAGGRDFTFSQVLAAGETVIFVLDPAGVYFNDSTGLRLSVNDGVSGAVPEPATWATMIVGFALVGGAMRRRRPVLRPAV